MSVDDFFNLNLDELFSVVLTSILELETAPTTGEVELEAAKTVVVSVKVLSVIQISNISEITEDQKAILAKI